MAFEVSNDMDGAQAGTIDAQMATKRIVTSPRLLCSLFEDVSVLQLITQHKCQGVELGVNVLVKGQSHAPYTCCLQ